MPMRLGLGLAGKRSTAGVAGFLSPGVTFSSAREGQIVQGMDLRSAGAIAIDVTHDRVTVEHSRVRHRGSRGLRAIGVSGLRLRDLDIAHFATPLTATPHASSTEECIALLDCEEPRLERLRLAGGSSCIYVAGGRDLYVDNLLAYNPFGPLPRGQFLQANGVHNVTLGNITGFANLTRSYVEDTISLFNCTGTLTIFGNWLLDGNNSERGWGFMEELNNWEQVIIVPGTRRDAVRQGCGGFCWAGTPNGVGGLVRVRDGHADGQGGRPAPASGGLAVGAFDWEFGELSGVAVDTLVECKYYNVPQIAWDEVKFAEASTFDEEDFTPNPPLSLSWPWQDWRRGPFLLVLNGPANTGGPVALDEATAPGTAVGLLHAESADPQETFTFSIESDPGGLFVLDGALVETATALTDGTYPVTFRVTGSRGRSIDLEHVFVVETGAPVNLWADHTMPSSPAWTKSGVTVSAGTGAGGMDELRETATEGTHQWGIMQAKAAGVKTYRSRLRIRPAGRVRLIANVFRDETYAGGPTDGYFFFSGTPGFVGGGGGEVMGSPLGGGIEDVGDGVYEIYMDFASSDAASMPIIFYTSAADYNPVHSGNAALGFDIANMRLEELA